MFGLPLSEVTLRNLRWLVKLENVVLALYPLESIVL